VKTKPGRDRGLVFNPAMERDSITTPERDLERAEDASDDARLEILEDLYRELESALDRHVGQSGPARH
jgi:hypothetical protein